MSKKELQYVKNPLSFGNLVVPKKKNEYRVWWRSAIKADYPEFWDSENGPVTHGQYIVDFYYKLKDIINASGYVISDEKQFKNEIATLIYHLSNEK